MTINVENLLSVDGAIARRIDGFEARPQQVEMAAAVERTMAGGGRLVVEAGTGVGKSFAYLIPAIRRIVDHDERVVVATNTINLQEQIIEQDVPLLNAAIPEEFSAVLVKGRGNYVSLRRLRLASERQERLCRDEESRSALHGLEEWAYSTTDGSLSTLPPLSRPEVWDYAQSDANNCMGRKCPTYDRCFYQMARRRMENGDLLVCNHALFFSDLALRARGIGFLPPYDHVILDEAHGAEDVASEHFGVSLSESRVMHLLRLLHDPRRRRGFLLTMHGRDDTSTLVEEAVRQTLVGREAMAGLFDDLLAWQARSGPRNGRINEPGVVSNRLTTEMTRLSDLLKLLREKATGEADRYELNSYAVRAADIACQAELLLGQGIEGAVYFLEGGGRVETPPARVRRRVSLRCLVVDVAPILAEHLFDRPISVVMTSATMATAPGDFTHVTGRLGCPSAETLQLGSPFDHARQMRVVVDQRMPEPGHPAWSDRLASRVDQLVRESDGGAFVLFTSFRTLDEVAKRLREPLADDGYPVLVQGADGRPGLLLKRFKEDPRSVLFGTASFWQGVDVRGEGLRNVIITRLPFEVPDRPVVEARHERIRADGGQPFVEDQLPRAIIRFRQGLGRLIRSQTDRGLVAVLDPRIATKSYGRLFLAALPEGIVVEAMEDGDVGF